MKMAKMAKRSYLASDDGDLVGRVRIQERAGTTDR